jgi:cytochrome P450
MNFARTATKDTEIGGQPIKAGDFVYMLYGAANRDPDAFGPTADNFDVGRSPNPHVSFGFGEHFCLGNSLARLEARVLFDHLVRRFSTVELAGDPERLRSNLMRSLVRLPVVFGA